MLSNLLTFASAADPDPDPGHLFTRSGALKAGVNAHPQKSTDIVDSGRSYQFQGQSGAVVLHGVGQRLKVNQITEKKASRRLEAERTKAFDHYLAIKTPRGKDPVKHSRAFHERFGSWKLYHNTALRAADASNLARKTGETVRSIGLVNKDMQKRMMKSFRPLPNPDARARAAYKKIQRDRRKEEAIHKKEQRHAKKKQMKRNKRDKRGGTKASVGKMLANIGKNQRGRRKG